MSHTRRVAVTWRSPPPRRAGARRARAHGDASAAGAQPRLAGVILPSGDQVRLSGAGQEAVVCEVGATLRQYDVGGRPVCWGFAETARSEGARGQVLAPWPNRLEDGRFEHDGRVGTAALDEPERHNAIHGLVRWLAWRVLDAGPDVARLGCVVHDQPAYPFTVGLEVTYRLGPSGLTVTGRVTNLGSGSAPFGLGFHTYLHAGAGTVDTCRLSLPARRRLVPDERMLPRAEEPIGSGPLAPFAQAIPGPIGDAVLDDCATGIEAGDDGRWRARFVPSGGEDEAVELWADAEFAYATVFTGDTLAPADRRRALALEPMTCPANALRTKQGVVVLEPGASFEASWGICPSALGPLPAS